MSNSDKLSAIKAEVVRIRKLKQNAEAAIELLRSDMERGKIHLRVCADPDFRRKLAEAIVEEAHPGYHGHCFNYADPVEGKVWEKRQGGSDPWPQSIAWRVVSVDSLVPDDYNFDPSVDWREADIPYQEMAKAFLESKGEEMEDGEIPSWVSHSEVIEWARLEAEEWAEAIDAAEDLAQEVALGFAEESILDEIVLDINQ